MCWTTVKPFILCKRNASDLELKHKCVNGVLKIWAERNTRTRTQVGSYLSETEKKISLTV